MEILRENTINRMGSQSRKYRNLFQRILNSFYVRSDPAEMIRRCVKLSGNHLEIGGSPFNLDDFNNIYVVSIGKCSLQMSRGLEEVLKDRVYSEIIISTDKTGGSDGRRIFLKGDHPYPGKNSFKSATKFLNILSSVKKNDLLISLISGGASSMLIAPPPGISIADINTVNKELIRSEATIKEINCVRKHLSLIKGGRAAEIVFPAKVINLIISDTPDGSPSTIGSGIFAWDDTTYKDAVEILDKYDLKNKIPLKTLEYLELGIAGEIGETPQSNSESALNNSFYIAGDNNKVLEGIKEDLKAERLNIRIVSSSDSGEVKERVSEFADRIKEILLKNIPSELPVLLLSGGEYTVSVKGKGLGGRNSEFVLRLLKELKDIDGRFFAFSFGSDGIDGPTNAAGAWIDENSYTKSIKNVDDPIDIFLRNSDSYTFFNKIDQLIKTGRTGTNIMDIRGVYIP